MWVFLLGFLLGVITVFVVGYVVLFDVSSEKTASAPFIDQFQPIRIPAELKVFLRSHTKGNFVWESCLSLSLFLHFLFQEHKDTRKFRRWVYKKLQLELNDVTTRYAASRIITSVQIRELSVGTESPVIKNVRVEKFVMSENHDLFDEISFEVDVDYRGGFETSIDLNMILGRSAHLSIKVMKLAGKARIVMSRRPFAHWYFAFIEMPQLDFKIDSKFQGHQLKKVIPLITTAFRKAFQRKHVWPNYKIRYRPILPHPLLQPAPPISSFDHIKLNGTGLEVTVLQCTRLNMKIFRADHTDVYCTVTLDQRPFLSKARLDSTHCISVMLTFTRKGASDSIGLNFCKNDVILKSVKVSDVDVDSTAEKCGFKRGDVLLAINSVPIRNEKQAMRLLSGTAGDLLVLVERDLSYYFEDEIDDTHSNVDAFNEEFICISKKNDKPTKAGARRGSNASVVSMTDSFTQTSDDGIQLPSRKASNELKTIDATELEDNEMNEESGRFLRAKSTHIPHIPKLSVQRPSTDIIRSRSESDLFGEIAASTSTNTNANSCNFASAILDEENESDLMNENKTFNEFMENFLSKTDGEPTEESTDVRKSGDEESTDATKSETPQPSRADSPKSHSKRERIQARANEMALKLKINAGRSKFNDLLWNRAKTRDEIPSPTALARSSLLLFGDGGSEAAECAMEVDSHHFANSADNTPHDNIGSPSLELRVMDKSKRRWMGRKRKSPSPFNHRNDPANCSLASANNDSVTVEGGDPTTDTNERPLAPSLITSRTTKSVPLTKNPLWGQSLHFGLDQRTTKYLNITVHSRRKFGATADESTKQEASESSTLLGYASVYIPQIVEDCQLTLSNNHKEVFHLRPPSASETGEIPAEFTELGRRTGFDARLCYGDVTVGFRFFPQGLPDGTIRAATSTSATDESPRHTYTGASSPNSRHEVPLESVDVNNPLQSPTQHDDEADYEPISVAAGNATARSLPESLKLNPHKWIQFHLRHESYPCGVCHGKIWLKWASRCTICNFICHNKCLDRANANEQCVPSLHDFDDNANFVVLDEKDLANPNITPSNVPHDLTRTDSTSMTRRRRIATTVSEKLSSTWRNVGAVASASRRKTINLTVDGAPPPPTPTETSPPGSGLAELVNEATRTSASNDTRNGEEKCESNSEITTIDKIVGKEFLAGLSGSRSLNSLQFEPGNAYNSQIIGDTKNTGLHVFDDIADLSKRKTRINEQIDIIQSEIDHINQARRRFTSVTQSDLPTSSAESSEETRRQHSSSSLLPAEEIERLDVKREALALLMLHYCSGLSYCHEKEEMNEQSEVADSNKPFDVVVDTLPDADLTLHGPEY